MIIRNPSNIIAKHFRLINAILLIPTIYLLWHFRDISHFFRGFVANGYKTAETNFADTYVTTLSYIVLILMVIYNAYLYIILVARKKNGLFYLIPAIIYLVLILLNLFFFNSMNGITTIDYTFANFVRDMSNIAVIPQYALVVITAVRAIGFNFKTFSFEKNTDFVVDEDADEIEIKIGSEEGVAKRNAVHLLRELKYYVLENKFVFSVIGVVAGVAILIGLYMNFRVHNRVYTVNQAVTSENFDIALKESYITSVDYSGNTIAKDKYFLVIKLRLQNKKWDVPIDRATFRITFGDTTLFPVYDRSSRFIDIGKPYEGQVIKQGSEDDYVFAYELTEKQVKGTYKLKIVNKIEEVDGNLRKSYKTINVKPINLTKRKNLGEVNMGKEIKLKETMLGNSIYTLKSAKIEEFVPYTRKDCDSYNCTYTKINLVPSMGQVLLVIDDTLSLDEKTSYFKNSKKDFYGDFVTLRILPPKVDLYDPDWVTSPMRDVTPKEITDRKLYEVSMEALKADKIQMLVRIRNNYFTIIIKD